LGLPISGKTRKRDYCASTNKETGTTSMKEGA